MNDNPKWKPFLDVLPESLHPIIKPVLADWDKGIQEQFNSIHETYKPYKHLVDNKVNPQHIDQGLDILGQITEDPAEFLKKVDSVYNLNLTNPPQAQQQDSQSTDDDYNEDFDGMDITKHPAFQQIAQALETIQASQQTREQRDKEAEDLANFEAYLDTLQEKYKDSGGIDRELVTAYMSQGLDGDAAVKAYQDKFAAMLQQSSSINQNNVQQDQVDSDNPPAVMGSSGSSGSGLPDTAVTPANWTDNETNAAVEAMLRAAAE